ncbi:hypothetical protein BDP27DRAFT_1312354 [Rhodocollybia butyracea]|uniref:Uncharacterized protein n=1 Tax=Rhodocollybia butyracea TaxID=206335 RepID=A0A9P5UFL6_9AGAR|nr:hypothetical protein BDP27DRAFT_1312354 [Rhodocollybia butyracea]
MDYTKVGDSRCCIRARKDTMNRRRSQGKQRQQTRSGLCSGTPRRRITMRIRHRSSKIESTHNYDIPLVSHRSSLQERSATLPGQFQLVKTHSALSHPGTTSLSSENNNTSELYSWRKIFQLYIDSEPRGRAIWQQEAHANSPLKRTRSG